MKLQTLEHIITKKSAEFEVCAGEMKRGEGVLRVGIVNKEEK